MPANIDVLLCEQEVKADDTPAVRAVMESDKKRVKVEEEVGRNNMWIRASPGCVPLVLFRRLEA